MRIPDLGATVRLYPAPRADVEHEPGRPLALRRVQDGAGNYGRFLPDEGGERVFDTYWHDRLLAGDVCVTDPRVAFAPARQGLQSAPVRAEGAPRPNTPPAAPSAPTA